LFGTQPVAARPFFALKNVTSPALLKKMDTDGDGKVSRDELNADEFSRMWVAIGDQSGRLSLEEITAAIREYYTSTDPTPYSESSRSTARPPAVRRHG
jgi:hypothetical protein